MHRKKNLSENFIKKLIELSAGKLNPGLIDNFIFQTEKILADFYFTESSEANLLRIIQNQFDISFFISDLINYPHHLEILVSVSVHSNYLTDILVRNPEYFYWVVNPDILRFRPDEKYFNEVVKNSTDIFKSFEAKVNALKNVKKKEILRIGLRDFYRYDDLIAITKELSQLATAISSKLFSLCYQEVLNKYHIDKVNRKYCVIALGKLGAQELNYSSDIDLICFYDKNTLIDKRIYFNEIISETIKLFIDSSSHITPNGYLYRVDFRLRPDGRNSPLANSLAEYIRYYETRSEDWEKQMLIKTGFLCGSKSLYKKFFEFKDKLVFSSPLVNSPVVQIKKLKHSLEQRVADDNIKLSSGGIRDIEFSVQTLQMLNGKKYSSIRMSGTLDTINALNRNKLISDEETIFLSNAYKLFRRIEHYLQLMNDRQTHSIPESGELLSKIAHYLGYKNSNEFKNEIDGLRKKVAQFYKSIMQQDDEKDSDIKILFSDKTRAKNNLEYLRTGRSLLGTKQFDSKTTDAFEKINHQLTEYLSNCTDPDLVLENFAKIIRLVPLPKIWYEEFQNKKFFDFFLRMCEYSQKAVNKFFEEAFIKDDFLSRTCFDEFKSENLSQMSLPQIHFRICIQLLNKDITAIDAASIISEYHLLKIKQLVENEKLNETFKENYFIAGMGSFASSDMNFSSDVDLIFVVKDLSSHSNAQKIFQNLLNKLKTSVKGTEFDCRLRPEGKSSYLVWDFDQYKKYFYQRARVWELQAMTKCRFVEGNKKLFNNFLHSFIERVKVTDTLQIKNEIKQMRLKLITSDETGFHIKKSPGGLLDIDFIISFLILKKISDNYSFSGKSTSEKFKLIENTDLKKSLSQNYNFLKSVEFYVQSITDSRTSRIPVDSKQLKKLSLQSGFESEREFNNAFNNIVKMNLELFKETFEKSD
jgi:glutamate-ammonia-ligase adenylyltransferase